MKYKKNKNQWKKLNIKKGVAVEQKMTKLKKKKKKNQAKPVCLSNGETKEKKKKEAKPR